MAATIQMQAPKTFIGSGSQSRAFEEADDGALVFASDHGRAKQYHVCADHAALYNFIFAQVPERRCYYEMIRPEMPVKLYFDLDLKGTAADMDDQQAELIDLVNQKLNDVYELSMGVDDVLALRSDGLSCDGAHKASRHLIWPSVYFESVSHVKAFVDENILPGAPSAVDKGVYTKNRCFRLFGNRKLGSERVLKCGRSDGSELTRKKLFDQAYLTLGPPPGTMLLQCEQPQTPESPPSACKATPTRRVKRQRLTMPMKGAGKALPAITEWITEIIRQREAVTEPSVTRVRDAVHRWTFVRTNHKNTCRLGGRHEHQNLAVNIDIVTGTVFYKCYGDHGHPVTSEGDIQQTLRLVDMPPELRMVDDMQWLLEEAEYGDNGFARVYVQVYAKAHLVCTHTNGEGFAWNKSSLLWEPQSHQSTMMHLSNTLQDLYMPLRERVETRSKALWGKIWGTISSMRALYGVMMCVNGHRRDTDFQAKLNSSQWEIPIINGEVIDVTSLETRTRTPEDLWSWESRARYMPDNDCSVAMGFFRDVADVDAHPERNGYERCLQTAVGALLCGDVGAKIMEVWHGRTGNNSKSTAADILEACVPGCFTAISSSVLAQLSTKGGGGPSPEKMQIVGKRVCVLADTGKAICLDEENVKTITGGDLISARPCHGACINFRAICKPLLITNRTTTFDVQQKAMKDRFHYFPFTRVFRKCKKNAEKIEGYKTKYIDQFFTAFIRGAHDYAEHLQLRTCDWLEAERARYIDSINPLGVFVDDCCVKEDASQAHTADLYEAYKVWCAVNGERYKSIKWFGSQMVCLFGPTKTMRIDNSRAKGFLGVALAT